MGESLPEVRPQFNSSIEVEVRPGHLTSDAGVIALREAFERLGMVDWLKGHLVDKRSPLLITYPLIELVTTAIYLLAQGYRDHDDSDALRQDAALRLAVSERRGVSPLIVPERPEGKPPPKNPARPEHLPSQPTLSRMSAMLSDCESRKSLREGLAIAAGRRLRAQRCGNQKMPCLTLDVDSLLVAVHGQQPEATYNGHYKDTGYHPLVAVLGETGDLVDVDLRRGNAHTAEGALDFIEPLLDRLKSCAVCEVLAVRFDAGFPDEPTLKGLEQRGTPYVARVKNNAVLNRMAAPYLVSPPGPRPAEPRTWFHEMTYRAKSWSRERRVVLVVFERKDELFPDHFWLITSWTPEEKEAKALLEMYRKRGTAEGHLGELLSALNPALSSSPRPGETYAGQPIKTAYYSVDSFAVNEVRLLLNAWAYTAMHICRSALEHAIGQGLSLQRLRDRVLKVAARVLVSGRRATFVIAQTSADLWRSLWTELARLSCPNTA